jgi:hypothetical protein
MESPSRSGGDLDSVDCISASDCWAVGSNFQGALIERWNGSAWSVVVSPTVAHASLLQLSSVACRSSSMCMAVGSYSPNGTPGSGTLTEQWNGHTWRILRSVNEPDGQLLSVACPASLSCIAVGSYAPSMGANEHALVERWNGSAWSIVARSVVKAQL